MTVKERLKEFIKYKGISVRKFEESINVSYSYINNIRVSIQPDKLSSIANQYPELNTEWLLTGVGDMIKNSEQEDKSESKDDVIVSREAWDMIKQQIDTINKQNDTILSQQKTIDALAKKTNENIAGTA